MKNKLLIGIVIVAAIIGGFIFLRPSYNNNEAAGIFSTDVAGLAEAKVVNLNKT